MNDPVLPNLTVQQLEYLVAAAREPTFARAAASVGVSPSALSQGLAELERRVGVALFEPSGRGRVLTEQADQVVRYAERVLADTEDLARWVEGRRTGRSGPLPRAYAARRHAGDRDSNRSPMSTCSWPRGEAST